MSIVLEQFDTIVDWAGKPIDRSEADRLIVGDIVRVIAKKKQTQGDNLTKGAEQWVHHEAFYVQITKVVHYAYGGIHKPRKFHGTVIDVGYMQMSDDLLHYGDSLTFRKTNICEIPHWHRGNPLSQPKAERLNAYLRHWCRPKIESSPPHWYITQQMAKKAAKKAAREAASANASVADTNNTLTSPL